MIAFSDAGGAAPQRRSKAAESKQPTSWLEQQTTPAITLVKPGGEFEVVTILRNAVAVIVRDQIPNWFQLIHTLLPRHWRLCPELQQRWGVKLVCADPAWAKKVKDKACPKGKKFTFTPISPINKNKTAEEP